MGNVQGARRFYVPTFRAFATAEIAGRDALTVDVAESLRDSGRRGASRGLAGIPVITA